jgi:twitching motility protein PilT
VNAAEHAWSNAPAVGRSHARTPEVEAPTELVHLQRGQHRAVLDGILSIVVACDASDLHLTVGAPPTLRLHGILAAVPDYPPLEPGEVEELAFSILTEAQRRRFEETNELDLAFSLDGTSRFRVNVFRQRGSVAAALRLIPRQVRGLEDLGLPSAVAALAQLPRGLVLVTGPTGSGKSTTLAGLLDLANRTRSAHIVTIEDPIEYIHEHQRCIVNQREVGTDTASFAEALKRGLRQDPDIILVGELRDLETTSVALTAAETGHLVLATLHTQDAAQTVDRLIDIFPPHQQHQIRVQVAATLQAVVCQALVPLASGKGRALAAEVMIATPAIRALVREGKSHQLPGAIQTGADAGMVMFDTSLAHLVRNGQVSRRVALDLAHDVSGFKKLVGAA